MYESFYGFDQRPFLTVPTLDRYFPASSIEAAYQTVTRAIQRCEGPVAIFGGAGLGKTMCCLRIAASIPRSFDVVTLASAQVITRRALLQSLLYELGLPCRDASEGALRLALLERLQPSDENSSEGLVLIVDEAQTLSIKLLEELRILTNVVYAGVPRLRLVLCGTLRLEETLTHPHMESLNQRLAARCYLTPLNHDESDRYVQHKIELCGQRAEGVITSDGLEAIYRAADGIPRLIDQVADQSLLLGAKEKIRPINATVVGYAWSLLQQLPNPWSDAIPGGIARAGRDNLEIDEFDDEDDDQAIEFGSLDDHPVNETLSYERKEGRASTSPPRFVADTAPSRETEPTSGNLFSSFTETAEDEFPIPIQSLRDYQSLSGAALGDLSHDTLASHESESMQPSEWIEEAADFIDCVTNRASTFEQSSLQERPNLSPFGIGQNDLGRIERQIENEMRNLVSSLNAEAIREHFESDPSWSENAQDGHNIIIEDSDPTAIETVWKHTLDQANSSSATRSGNTPDVIIDDRDMIHVEEDEVPSRGTETTSEASHARASIHPYARLFSQLRNS